MMGFWDRIKTVADPAARVAGAVVPGKAGNIARIIEQVIDNDKDPQNLGALRVLASRVIDLEIRVSHLEDVLTKRAK